MVEPKEPKPEIPVEPDPEPEIPDPGKQKEPEEPVVPSVTPSLPSKRMPEQQPEPHAPEIDTPSKPHSPEQEPTPNTIPTKRIEPTAIEKQLARGHHDPKAPPKRGRTPKRESEFQFQHCGRIAC